MLDLLKKLRRRPELFPIVSPFYLLKTFFNIQKYKFNQSELAESGFFSDANGIIHIGAHHAEERFFYAKLKKDVVWIEANPTLMSQINLNLRGFTRQKALQGLLGSIHQKKVEFFISNNNGLSSSVYQFHDHKKIWPDVKMVDSIFLDQFTLEEMISINRIKKYNYNTLVLDVQGAELNILKGIKDLNQWIHKIKLETTNFKTYKKIPLKKDIDKFLLKKGFLNIENKTFNAINSKKCMNSFYIRK